VAGIAKSVVTPAHLTTLPVRSHRPDQASTVGLTKRFTIPSAVKRPNLFSRQAAWAAQPNNPRHVPEPNGAKERPCRISKPDRKTVVPNCSAFGIYWKSLSDSLPSQESLQRPAQPKTWQGQRSHPAYTTRPQTRRAPTKQSVMGTNKILMNPIKAWSQISTLSWLRDQPGLNCDCSTV